MRKLALALLTVTFMTTSIEAAHTSRRPSHKLPEDELRITKTEPCPKIATNDKVKRDSSGNRIV